MSYGVRDRGIIHFGHYVPHYCSPQFAIAVAEDIEKAKSKLAELGDEFRFTSLYFRDFLVELRRKVFDVTEKFNNVFGTNIFA